MAKKEEEICIYCGRNQQKNTFFISFLGRASGHEYFFCENCLFNLMKEIKSMRKERKLKKFDPLIIKSRSGITKISLESFLKSQEFSNEKPE